MFMISNHLAISRSLIALALVALLGACGGSGPGTGSVAESNIQPPTTVPGKITLPAPVLSFNDTGLSVTDGITRTGLWRVDAPSLDWEFSLDQGVTWTRGSGSNFEVIVNAS